MNENDDEKFDRLMRCIEAYGAAPERWPAAERAALSALLAESAKTQNEAQDKARHALESARGLDALLDRAAPPAPSPELTADVLAAAAPSRIRQWLALLWPFGPAWQPVSAFALAALLGLYLGAAVPSPAPVAQSPELLAGEIDGLILSPDDVTEAL